MSASFFFKLFLLSKSHWLKKIYGLLEYYNNNIKYAYFKFLIKLYLVSDWNTSRFIINWSCWFGLFWIIQYSSYSACRYVYLITIFKDIKERAFTWLYRYIIVIITVGNNITINNITRLFIDSLIQYLSTSFILFICTLISYISAFFFLSSNIKKYCCSRFDKTKINDM